MKSLAIIPSRYGSTRFPGKPLAEIEGKTMIQRVYEQCSKVFECVCVATDDERIESHVRSFGGDVVMTSTEHRSGTDRVFEAYQKFTCSSGKNLDIIINVQGDEPLISPLQLRTLENAFTGSEDIQIATLIKKIENKEDLFNPNIPKVVIDSNGFALYFSRSTIPYVRDVDSSEWFNRTIFYKHIGLYGYRPHILEKICNLPQSFLEKNESLEQLRWLENGLKIKTVETSENSHSVDTPKDISNIIKLIKK